MTDRNTKARPISRLIDNEWEDGERVLCMVSCVKRAVLQRLERAFRSAPRSGVIDGMCFLLLDRHACMDICQHSGPQTQTDDLAVGIAFNLEPGAP